MPPLTLSAFDRFKEEAGCLSLILIDQSAIRQDRCQLIRKQSDHQRHGNDCLRMREALLQDQLNNRWLSWNNCLQKRLIRCCSQGHTFRS